ncbi:DUF481 domain-containing protein [Paracoccus aeridis]|uniref:DUF481 domain-containing protein n=1 Tax=Paracoccus aeridis TaxID=1966466 RepID=UPI0010A9A4E5|nr:DUF481 domain-containing protein [Paracoccus aeridis]
MKTLSILLGATALAAAVSSPVFAQTEFAPGANVTGIGNLDDRLDDIEDAVQDDFDRSVDRSRFGRPDTREGLFGSVALTYTGRDGNDENQDFSLAGRLSHNQGPFQQSVGILLEYAEDDDGDAETEDTSVIYDGNYYFNEQLYAFILGRVSTDGLAEDYDDPDLTPEEVLEYEGRSKRDAFIGIGPGYRIINNDQTAWRVQAGVGIRYTQTVDFAEPDGLDSNTDTGYIASSRFYHKFNDQFFLTNDTDYLTSDANDLATNELGLNFRMSDNFATRVSYRTEYQSDREIRTDNTLGVSLVVGF